MLTPRRGTHRAGQPLPPAPRRRHRPARHSPARPRDTRARRRLPPAPPSPGGGAGRARPRHRYRGERATSAPVPVMAPVTCSGRGRAGAAPLLPPPLPPLPAVPPPQARPQVSPGAPQQHRRRLLRLTGGQVPLLACRRPRCPRCWWLSGALPAGGLWAPAPPAAAVPGMRPHSHGAVVGGGGPGTAVGGRASGGVGAIGRDGAVPSALGWRCLRRRTRDARPGAAGPDRAPAASGFPQGAPRAGPPHRGDSGAAQVGGHGATAAGLRDQPREMPEP